MRSKNLALSASLAAAGVIGAVGLAPSAHAYDPSINGKFLATIVGDWARSRQVAHAEPVVRSVWTITSSCTTAQDCTGQVVSDQGWTAPIRMTDGNIWYLRREIPNWETCEDGSSHPGTDYILFYPSDPETGYNVLGSPVFAGNDRTVGPAGVCGNNLPLDIAQPFRLDRIS